MALSLSHQFWVAFWSICVVQLLLGWLISRLPHRFAMKVAASFFPFATLNKSKDPKDAKDAPQGAGPSGELTVLDRDFALEPDEGDLIWRCWRGSTRSVRAPAGSSGA